MNAHEIVRVFLTEGWAAGKPSPERQKAIEALGSVRAEARAEALKKAAVAIAGMNQMAPSALNDDYLIGYGFGIRDCQIKIESIIADEPKEREAEPCSKCVEQKGAPPCEFCGPPAWEAYQDNRDDRGEDEESLQECLDRMDGYGIDGECGSRG